MSQTLAPTGDAGGAAGPPADLAGVARSGSLATAGAVVAAAGGLLLTLVVGRGLGPDGAGLFFEAVAVFTIASSLATFGADTALLRFLSRARAHGRVAELRRILLVGVVPVVAGTLLVTAALWIWTPALVSLVIHGRPVDQAGQWFRYLLPFLVVGTLATTLAQATRSFGGVLPFVAVQNVLLPIGRPVLILIAVLLGWSALAVPLAWGALLIPALVVAAVTLARQVRRAERGGGTRPPARGTGEIAAEFWRFSAVRGLAAAVDLSLIWFDVLLIGAVRSTAEAGIYATASRFVISGTLVMQAMRLAIAPQISGLMSTGQTERAGRIYRVATLWIVLTSWPLYLALAAFGPLLLGLFGRDFTAAGPALTVLALAMLVNLGTGNVGTVLLMAGRSSWLLANKTAAVIANVVLNLLLVPAHGILGAAIAWAVAIAVDNLAAVLEVRYALGLHGYGRPTAGAALAAAVCFGAGGLLTRSAFGVTAVSLIGYLAVAGAIYAAVLFRWRRPLHLAGAGAELSRLLGRRPAAGRDEERA